jgi:integrase
MDQNKNSSTEAAVARVKGTGHAAGQHGKGRIFKRGKNIWWVQWHVRGQQFRESSHSEKKGVAEKLLMRRLVEAEDGTGPTRQRPVTYEDMRKTLVTERLIPNPHLKKSLAEADLKHLDTFFAGMRSTSIDEDSIKEFTILRQATGASNATTNHALKALRRMFRLSVKKIKDPPEIKLLPDPHARKGFLTREEYLRLWAVLPDYLRPIFTFGCRTGMRMGELKNLTWLNVNRAEGIIALDADQTKNSEERKIPYRQVPELADLMDQLWRQGTDASGLVFIRAKGKSLGCFRKAWIRACIKSFLGRMGWECPVCPDPKANGHKRIEVEKQTWPPEQPPKGIEAPNCTCGAECKWKYDGLIFHDLRRTAIRDLRRAGVSESVAMKISGHKTREVFERYNIIDNADIVEAMEKLERFQRAEDAKLERPGTRPN